MKAKWDRNSEEYKEHRRKICRESTRKRREAARAAGLCIQCVLVPPMLGRTLCKRCMAKQSAYSKKYASSRHHLEED